MTANSPHSTARRATLATLAAVVCVALAALLPATSSAYVGEGKSLPYFHGSGYVKITGYTPSGTAQWRYGDGKYCVYIQFKYTAILGLDSGWSRLTEDNCGGYTSYVSWSAPTSRAYNGVKFRLCQDIRYATDPCGGDVNIGYTR